MILLTGSCLNTGTTKICILLVPLPMNNLFDVSYSGPPYHGLEWTETMCVDEGHVLESMVRGYVQLSTFVASECNFHGLHALLRNRN